MNVGEVRGKNVFSRRRFLSAVVELSIGGLSVCWRKPSRVLLISEVVISVLSFASDGRLELIVCCGTVPLSSNTSQTKQVHIHLKVNFSHQSLGTYLSQQ